MKVETRVIRKGDTVGRIIKGHEHLFQLKSIGLYQNSNTGEYEVKFGAFALGNERREHNVTICAKDVAREVYRLISPGKGRRLL